MATKNSGGQRVHRRRRTRIWSDGREGVPSDVGSAMKRPLRGITIVGMNSVMPSAGDSRWTLSFGEVPTCDQDHHRGVEYGSRSTTMPLYPA